PTICSSNCCRSAILFSSYRICASLHCQLHNCVIANCSKPSPCGCFNVPFRNSAICNFLGLAELLLFHSLIQHHRHVAAHGIHHRHQPLRRCVHQEQQLGVNLFPARHGSQRFDLLDGDHAPFHYACLEAVFW